MKDCAREGGQKEKMPEGTLHYWEKAALINTGQISDQISCGNIDGLKVVFKKKGLFDEHLAVLG